MNTRHLLTAAAAALVLTVGSAVSAADMHRGKSRVVIKQTPHHTIIKERFRGRPSNVTVRERFRGHPRYIVNTRFRGRHFVPRTRVVEVLRARHIRYVGVPFLYGGTYLVRCYDQFGRLAYCQVNPYTGAFIGFTFRL